MPISEIDGKYISTSADMTAEVGDTKQVSFYPQVKLMKWDNEVNFSVRYSSDLTDAVYSKDAQDIVSWTGKDGVAVKMYETVDPNDNGSGGFEFEFELPEKPATNKFDLTIQTKGLEFIYNSELTQKEIDSGISRPDNVVGSIAAYHDSKTSGDYKAGKAFHIYRPKATDKEGSWVWCDLKIDTDNGILSVIIPQEFIDKAVYPVLVDPTFGYTTIGGTTWGSINDQCPAFITTADASVSIDKLVCYCKRNPDSGGTVHCKGVILDGTTGTIPLLTNGATPAATISGAAAWVDLPYSTKPSVVNGNGYRLGGVSDSGWPLLDFYYDGDLDADTTYSYATPGSWSANTGEHSNFKLSIYASYTSTPSANFLKEQYWYKSGELNHAQ